MQAALSRGSIPLNRPSIQLAICSLRLEPPKLSSGIKYFVWDQIFRRVEKRRSVYQDVAPINPLFAAAATAYNATIYIATIYIAAVVPTFLTTDYQVDQIKKLTSFFNC